MKPVTVAVTTISTVRTDPGKSCILIGEISRPGKSWKKA